MTLRHAAALALVLKTADRRSIVMLCLLFASCVTPVRQQPAWSNASLIGTYDVATTIKPYVKFAGGPRLGKGRISFDGHGSFSGEQTYEGEHDQLSGKYLIQPDGRGIAYVTSIAQDGSVARSEYALKIENENKVLSVSYGLDATGDWVSPEYLGQHAQPALTSVLTRTESAAVSTRATPPE
jgi:hypothetical protein